MSLTLNQIQQRMAGMLDQTTTVPTATGAEYSLRTSFVNQALEEWTYAYEWEALRKQHFPGVTGLSQGSISLPNDFNKMASFPLYFSSGFEKGESWQEIKPEEAYKGDTTDNFFYILGNRSAGKTMVWNPATMASGASLLISYYSFPTSFASPADTSPIPNAEFLVQRAVASMFETRSDARFQISESRARETLRQMVENENTKSNALFDKVRTPEWRQSFRLGRD